MKTEKTDAEGKFLIEGALYGYSKRSNGHVKTHVGILEEIGEKTVKLKLKESRKAIYDNNTEVYTPKRDYVRVTPNSIFNLD